MSSFLKSAACFLAVFGVLGSPIGGCAIAVFAAASIAPKDPSGAFFVLFAISGAGVSLGYIWGFLPSLATGAAACVLHRFTKRFSWPLAIILGLVSGAIFSLVMVFPIDGRPPQYASDYAMMIFTCLVPTVSCWRIAAAILADRPLPQPVPAADDAPSIGA